MNLIPSISILFLACLVGGIAATGSRRKKAESWDDLAPFLSTRRIAVSMSRQKRAVELREECCDELGCSIEELEEYRKDSTNGRPRLWVDLALCLHARMPESEKEG